MGFGSRDSGEMAGRAAGRAQRPAFSHHSAGGPFSGGSPRRLLGRRCRGVRPPRVPASPPMIRSSFARRQQYRRLCRGVAGSAMAIGAGALAIIALGVGAPALAGVLVLVTIASVLDTRRWLRLASRSRVGARSEDAVRAALTVLKAEGWQLCHSLPYRGHGDIDSVAIAPTGMACVIETKTRTFHAAHLAKTREMAAWLCRYRRRWCRAGPLAVLCVVGARSLERVEDDVLIVSLDRLVPALRVRAGTSPRPRFLAARESRC